MAAHDLTVNLTGAFLTVQAGLGGHAGRAGPDGVRRSSPRPPGLKGYPYVAPYCAAKHGVIGLMRALAAEPPRPASPSTRSAPAISRRRCSSASVRHDRGQDRAQRAARRAQRCAPTTRRAASCTPAEVAAAVLWLCSAATRLDHRPGHLVSGWRDMVSAPLSSAVLGGASKERLRLWLRLLRAARTIEGGCASGCRPSSIRPCRSSTSWRRSPGLTQGMTMTDLSRSCWSRTATSPASSTAWWPTASSSRHAAKATAGRPWSASRRPANRVRQMAGAHEAWVDELLAGVSEDESAALGRPAQIVPQQLGGRSHDRTGWPRAHAFRLAPRGRGSRAFGSTVRSGRTR